MNAGRNTIPNLTARVVVLAAGLALVPQVAMAGGSFRPMNITQKNYNDGKSNTAARSIPISAYDATRLDGTSVSGLWNWDTDVAVECPVGVNEVPEIARIGDAGGGLFAVGLKRDAPPYNTVGHAAILWDLSGGGSGEVFDLGANEPWVTGSWATGTSGDGAVVGGSVFGDADGQGQFPHAVLWVNRGAAELLAEPAGTRSSEVFDVSRDGSIALGAIHAQGVGGPYIMPTRPIRPTTGSKGIVWNAGGYTVVEPGVAGADALDLAFTAISGDSSVASYSINTTRSNSKGGIYAMDSGAFTPLDGGDVNGDGVINLLDDHDSFVNALSGDGSIVGGSIVLVPGEEQAVVWVRDINGDYEEFAFADYLGSFGVTGFGGWTLGSVTGVSDDGLSFSGWGINPFGQTEGWAATVPAPGGLAVVGLSGLVMALRRR